MYIKYGAWWHLTLITLCILTMLFKLVVRVTRWQTQGCSVSGVRIEGVVTMVTITAKLPFICAYYVPDTVLDALAL